MAVLPFFSNTTQQPIAQAKKAPAPVNMFAPPADTVNSTSANVQQAAVPFVQDSTTPFQANPAQMTDGQRKATAGAYGVQAGASVRPTESAGGAVAQTLGAAATGAVQGGMVGGPMGAAIGGGVGLVLGGLNAYIGNQQARAERDRINAANRESARLEAERTAKDEAWRQKYFLQTIEQARYERRKHAATEAWERSRTQGQTMQAAISNNANLKERYAKLGYI